MQALLLVVLDGDIEVNKVEVDEVLVVEVLVLELPVDALGVEADWSLWTMCLWRRLMRMM